MYNTLVEEAKMWNVFKISEYKINVEKVYS